jgi:hypothetical protein
MNTGESILSQFNDQPSGKIEGYKTLSQFIDEALTKAKLEQRKACAEALNECDKDVSGQCIWKEEAQDKVLESVI